DFALWSEVKPLISFFFDELFKITDQINGFDKSDIKTASDLFCDSYNAEDDQNVWFEKVKTIAEKIGFCPNMKEYKENPDKYKGNVGDVSSFIRIAVTGRQNSPDLYTVMQIIGSEKIKDRIRAYKESL
ncbi:MAG: glutamate--tRNA ligase, partial [Clostridia bacterium]